MWLDIRKNFLSGRVVESPSPEVFKERADVAQRNMVSGHGGTGLMTGRSDHSGLFQTLGEDYCKDKMQWSAW